MQEIKNILFMLSNYRSWYWSLQRKSTPDDDLLNGYLQGRPLATKSTADRWTKEGSDIQKSYQRPNSQQRETQHGLETSSIDINMYERRCEFRRVQQQKQNLRLFLSACSDILHTGSQPSSCGTCSSPSFSRLEEETRKLWQREA